jgi:hypothetical protein
LNTEIAEDDVKNGGKQIDQNYEREKSRMLLHQNPSQNQNDFATFQYGDSQPNKSITDTLHLSMISLIEICKQKDSEYSETITRASNLLLANNHHLQFSYRGNNNP